MFSCRLCGGADRLHLQSSLRKGSQFSMDCPEISNQQSPPKRRSETESYPTKLDF